jgi:hypothetical protein
MLELHVLMLIVLYDLADVGYLIDVAFQFLAVGLLPLFGIFLHLSL